MARNRSPAAARAVVAQARLGCIALALALLAACSSACSDPQPAAALATSPAAEPRTIPDLSVALANLQRMSSPAGGDRLIRDLDLSGDGRIDDADTAVLAALTAAARARTAESGIDLGIVAEYYEGPLPNGPNVFSLVTTSGGRLDISEVPVARLRELTIESRWLSEQAQLAAAAQAPLDRRIGGMLQAVVRGYDKDQMEPDAVCAAMAALDTSVYAKAHLPATAVLDLDSTVWAGNGSDVFLAAIIELKLPLPEANGPLKAFLKSVPGIDAAQVEKGSVLDNARLLLARATTHDLPVEQRVNAKDAFYQLVGLLTGVTVADAQRAAHVAVEQGALGMPPWKNRIFADRDGCTMAKVIRALIDRGIEVHLLSATPEMMVSEAARLLGLPVEHTTGSAIEIKDGRYTGRVRENSYAIKAPVTRQWLPSPPIVAFGDSPTSDFAMLLEATAVGFMVNPREAFYRRDTEEAGSRLVAVTFDGTEGELAKAPR